MLCPGVSFVPGGEAYMDKDGPQQVVRKADQLSEQLEPPNFGILLGEQASCLLFHEDRTASVANADGAQAVALPTADTVYVCRELPSSRRRM